MGASMNYHSLAHAIVGDVEIALDESDSTPPSWHLQVTIGSFAFGCEVSSPEVLREWANFFAETFRTGRFLDEEVSPGRFRHMVPKQLPIGRVATLLVVITKDGEYDDRYRICLDLPAGYLVQTPGLAQVEALVAAVEQAAACLAD